MAIVEDNLEMHYSCRICLDEGTRNDFIAPCKCKGSQQWVHRACLDKWRSIREDKAFSQCTECLASYKLICSTNETFWGSFQRKTRYLCYIVRDFSVVILGSNIVIGLLGFISYGIDNSCSGFLINIFKMTSCPYLFYYLTGVLLMLSLIGMVFSCLPRNEVTSDVICCSGCDGMYFYPYPYVSAGSQDACCCCPSECAGCHPVACGECGSCCAGAAVGEEAFICLVGVLVVFAVVGVFYCLAMGAYYLQYVTQRHLHVLQKRSLTQEYVVQDLAKGALPAQYRPPGTDDCGEDMDDLESGVLGRVLGSDWTSSSATDRGFEMQTSRSRYTRVLSREVVGRQLTLTVQLPVSFRLLLLLQQQRSRTSRAVPSYPPTRELN